MKKRDPKTDLWVPHGLELVGKEETRRRDLGP